MYLTHITFLVLNKQAIKEIFKQYSQSLSTLYIDINNIDKNSLKTILSVLNNSYFKNFPVLKLVDLSSSPQLGKKIQDLERIYNNIMRKFHNKNTNKLLSQEIDNLFD